MTAAAIAAAGATLGGYYGWGSGSPGGVTPPVAAGTANLWMDTNGGTCTRSASLVAYNDAAACATPGAAFTAASGGDKVGVVNGDYTGSAFTFSNGDTATTCTITGTKASDVTFIASAGVRWLCSLQLTNVTNIVIDGGGTASATDSDGLLAPGWDGMEINAVGASGTTANFTLKNLRISCSDAAPYILRSPGSRCNAQLSLQVVNNFTIQNVTNGPMYDASNCSSGAPTVFNKISNATFTNVRFKDVRYPNVGTCGAAQHTENVRLDVATGQTSSTVTFDGITISNGANSGQIGPTGSADGAGPSTGGFVFSGPGSYSGITMKNSVFYGPRSFFIGLTDAVFSTSDFVSNTFTGGGYFECDVAHCPAGYPASVRFISNIWNGACMVGNGATGGTFFSNLHYANGSPAGCAGDAGKVLVNTSGTAGVPSAVFTNYATNDFTLKACTSPAINVGYASVVVTPDKLGATRPYAAGTPDIGAYESSC